jgi:hypothetical protein
LSKKKCYIYFSFSVHSACLIILNIFCYRLGPSLPEWYRTSLTILKLREDRLGWSKIDFRSHLQGAGNLEAVQTRRYVTQRLIGIHLSGETARGHGILRQNFFSRNFFVQLRRKWNSAKKKSENLHIY